LHTNTTLSQHQETNSPIRQRNTSVLLKVALFNPVFYTIAVFRNICLTLLITKLHREASSAEPSQNPCQNPTDQINKGLKEEETYSVALRFIAEPL